MYVHQFQSCISANSYSCAWPTSLRFMKPDSDPGSQEVRQAFAETATRHTRIRCKLCQLQSSQEGLGNLSIISTLPLTRQKLIKQLSATPTLLPQNAINNIPEILDPQALLQANKATFFFRLVRYPYQQNFSAASLQRPPGTGARESQCLLLTERSRGR